MAFAALTIDLVSRFARFDADMGKLAQTAERRAQQIDRAFSGVSRTIATLGAVGAGGGFVAFAKEIVSGIAALDDLSEKTGASVEELSKIEQVVRIGGQSMEVAETAMIRLTKALAGGDEEAKGAGKALAALNLSAEELRKQDTAIALKRVAEALNQYEDGAGKTALVLDLLGKSGAQALPFLKDLATEQGIAVRVTAEQAAQAEALQKSLARLGNEIRGVAQGYGTQLIPALADWIAANREALRIGGSVTEMLRLFVFNLDAMTTERPGEQIRRLNKEIEQLGERLERVGNRRLFAESLSGDIADKRKQVEFLKFLQRQEAEALGRVAGGDTPGERQRFRLEGAKKPVLDYTSAVTNLGNAARAAADPFDQLRRQLEEQAARAGELGVVEQTIALFETERYRALTIAQRDELIRLAARIDLQRENDRVAREAAAATENFNRKLLETGRQEAQQLDELAQRYIDLVDPIAKYRRQLEEIARLRTARPELAPILVTAEFRIQEQIKEEMKKLGGNVKETTDQMTEFFKQAARNMQDAMANGFFDVMQGKFDGFDSRVKATFDRMVANALAAQANLALFGKDFEKTGQLGGFLGSLADGFKGSSPPGLQGPTPSGGNLDSAGWLDKLFLFGKGLFGFAHGGSFMVPGAGGTDSRVVAFRATPGERVNVQTPAQQRDSGRMVSISINVPVTFNGPVDRRAPRQIAAEMVKMLTESGVRYA